MSSAEAILEENQQLRQSVTEKDATIVVLQEQIAWLKQQLFGSGKSERLDAAQLRLHLDELERCLKDSASQSIAYERRAPKVGKHETPAERFKDLPVEETVVIEPEEVQAEPESFEQISQEETFEVDIHPPKLFKRCIVRPKYRRKADLSHPPIIAPAPKRVIDGSYASAGLLAWITLGKYVQHMPLYRQEKASAMWGAQLSRKTMADWALAVAEWLKPIYNYMRSDLLSGGYIQADETPVRYCDPDQKKGKTEQGWLWAISRPGGDVVFDWRLSRRHGELTSLLDGYRGLLQSDAYGAYEDYARRDAVTALGCMAHARRKFYEALKSHPREAALVLKLIAKLYEREADYRQQGLSPEERQAHRQDQNEITLTRLQKVISITSRQALPKSAIGKACTYAISQWPKLIAFQQHGIAEIDNNLMENAIRPSAIGKKNFLFIGHPEAGQRSAIIYSIVVSCQRHQVEPLEYLRDVLSRLPNMTNQDDIRALTPYQWSPLGNRH
ncbi:IS66 family transposase [Cerasicoccus arenae]|uniref:Transposase n=1 Tax=Cerasicoccus arenae TaxID=424488 RepID=A0A8J3DL14_9BACT|nr:IS66 family transposase [Cerasicoccus arenae]MBK1860087.1 IS66 family transposase [Cerasicoccus arenae]GHC14235.1 transposase [Cerasicoccus arenae]